MILFNRLSLQSAEEYEIDEERKVKVGYYNSHEGSSVEEKDRKSKDRTVDYHRVFYCFGPDFLHGIGLLFFLRHSQKKAAGQKEQHGKFIGEVSAEGSESFGFQIGRDYGKNRNFEPEFETGVQYCHYYTTGQKQVSWDPEFMGEKHIVFFRAHHLDILSFPQNIRLVSRPNLLLSSRGIFEYNSSATAFQFSAIGLVLATSSSGLSG